jgi:hypothetical protein
MKKGKKADPKRTERRVLARVLADELRRVEGSGDPIEVTAPKTVGGNKDITNVAADEAI